MDIAGYSRFEKHLRALEHLDPADIPGMVGAFGCADEGAVNAEIRRLLSREEAYLTQTGKISLVPTGSRIPKSPERILEIREAGKHLTELLYVLKEASDEGVRYSELDFLAKAYAEKYGLSLPVLGYGGFPHSVTVGTNGRIVHGYADATRFENGDVVTVDTAVAYRGAIADAAVAFVIGGERANPSAFALVSTLKSVLDANLFRIRADAPFSDFAFSFYDGCVSAGYRVVKNCNGHGVGSELHEPPWTHHWPNSETDRTFLSV